MQSVHVTRALFAVAVLGLATGLVLTLVGRPEQASLAWAAGAAVVLAGLVVSIVVSLWRGEFGLDIVAALSMTGALVLGETLAAAVVALMYAGGSMLEAFAERRAGRDMTALLARAPRSAWRLRGGKLEEVPLGSVEAGDRLLVRPGDVTPADGVVADGEALLDQSAMTGESLPVRAPTGAEFVSGCANAGGAFEMVASRRPSESAYAGIVRMVSAAQQSRAPMARLADRYAMAFLGLTVALAGGTWLVTHDPVRMLAVLVVATPCPLILAVPVAIVAGMSRCARAGVLIKNAGVLERLSRVTALLFDKTGTLTVGTPMVVGIDAHEDFTPDEILAAAGALSQGSSHVVSAAIAEHARRQGRALAPPRAVSEAHGAGLTGEVQGRRVAVGAYDHVAAHAADRSWAESRRARGGERGMTAYVGIGGRVAGAITLADVVRPEAARALARLRRSGVSRIVLVTGDAPAVANAAVKGLPVDLVIAGASPAEKVDTVRREHGRGTTVMVGDGVNDAPALAAADVGVAMGARGAAAASEAADAVILVDDLDRLPSAILIARHSRRIALQSVWAGMGLSLAGMVAASLGYLSPLEGALLQEGIDVAVIVNALRALRIQAESRPEPQSGRTEEAAAPQPAAPGA
ncbi:heavy metal translocating P-type ATPase [Alsobacter soli]|uniref:P-type Zn(2+) transporter n=1 Tax=Alsobacter soli TaxID=2109933 RepID=A0A2T1HUK6_9HYPH|nr:heavy metal translocating P-type ATPase [Alsobacter soli]PSC05308.1 heavy metal translocating P-type ATPase [Alsobacter soli]